MAEEMRVAAAMKSTDDFGARGQISRI